MLKTRILTALVALPLAFLLVFAASPDTFGLVLALLLMIGCWEFRKLGGMQRGPAGWLLLVLQAVLFFLLFRYRHELALHAIALLTAACLLWLLMLLRLVVFRPGGPADFQFRIVTLASALTALSFAWLSLYGLRSGTAGSWWLLLLFLTIWAADTGAYFIGNRWGRRKLAPAISPSKTIAGLVGGLLSAVLVCVAAAALIPAIEAGSLPLAVLALVTALVSVGGDLFISLHKRISRLKDSGALLPGHGGVLDRLDSLLAGAPFFALGKLVLGL